LDVSKNVSLQKLNLRSTGIETLDVSRNRKLVALDLINSNKLTSLYMKNGIKKNFVWLGGYDFYSTNLNYICCDEDEIDVVKKYMQNLAEKNLLADGWQMSNLTVTSDCGTESTKEIFPQGKTASYPNPLKIKNK